MNGVCPPCSLSQRPPPNFHRQCPGLAKELLRNQGRLTLSTYPPRILHGPIGIPNVPELVGYCNKLFAAGNQSLTHCPPFASFLADRCPRRPLFAIDRRILKRALRNGSCSLGRHGRSTLGQLHKRCDWNSRLPYDRIPSIIMNHEYQPA